MIGVVIGDIAGSTFEFDNTDDYNFPLFARGSDYTDDTICSVAVADAILSGKKADESTVLSRDGGSFWDDEDDY